MAAKEAKARIKINKMLEEAGWRFITDENGPANIVLESGVSLTSAYMNETWGEDFEKTSKGYIDYLLIGPDNRPIALVEAKRESVNPLNAKEQARKYANAHQIRYVFISNGNITYQWDLEQGNPQVISRFPGPESLGAYIEFKPDRQKLSNETVDADYIVCTQYPDYKNQPGWNSEQDKAEFIQNNSLKFLRPYQVEAIHKIQSEVALGKNRFLFEMATGTGKTLTSAAIIKLFLRTGNARRVLFLVDRLELEDQANKNFIKYLKNDFKTVIYKQQKDDWRFADIVVSTIQSLLAGEKFKNEFEPADFDLIISDEAHRSIGGNSRAVFEYFQGYKLGLTATPKDYLKGVNQEEEDFLNPREWELRLLRDTYTTFGCEDGEPTYRYSLLDGVKDGFLINPVNIDARTEITTKLLSEKGYAVVKPTADGGEEEQTYVKGDFEKKFFSKKTNLAFCEAFINHALRDPITNEIGKTIVFCVSQAHARKITQILNELADVKFPGKYNSDFAVQVTSLVADAQQMTINFANNNLNGKTRWLPGYDSCKTRVCVTVGMMTTGYDCEDLLNLCLMRPVFSPTDFIQMKGRGTRKYTFQYKQEDEHVAIDKESFKLFDFFANCEYFEEKYDYEQKITVSVPGGEEGFGGGAGTGKEVYKTLESDAIRTFREEQVGLEGMRIDREMYRNRVEDRMRSDEFIKTQLEAGNWDQINHYIRTEVFDKPEDYINLDKLQELYKVDYKLSIREVIEKVFGIRTNFKEKDELLEEEFQKFIATQPPLEDENITVLRHFFKAYIVDKDIRRIVKDKTYQELNSHPAFTMDEFKQLSPVARQSVPVYVETYVPLDKYAA
ncbi:MAG: DEAD/DEAH box helicase family protein [Bacteroidetes bacterium]|nr:DEAD/DEAH box helicase family protein [Bacteroidota bacterium]